jgi:NRPS condensation-like uncharacterized protein
VDRPLDGLETVFYLGSQVARINAVAIAQVRGPLTAEGLRRALDAAQRRHPLLGVHVAERGAAYHFVSEGTPPIPLRVVPRDGEQHWRREAEAELDQPMPLRQGPLVRAVLLEGRDGTHDLLVAFNHTIGDGMSAIALVRELLEVAAGQPPREALPEGPTARQANPLPVQGLRGTLTALREVVHLVRTFRRRKPQVLRWDARVPHAARHTRLIQHRFPPAATQALAAKAKAEGTTLTGALAAALLWALAEDVGGDAPAVACSVPANLRPQMQGVDPAAFGYYSWGVGVVHAHRAGLRFWDSARRAKRDVDAELARGAAWRSLAVVELQARMARKRGPAWLAGMLDRSGANSVSNVGRVEAPERIGALAWTDLHFAPSADGAGAGVGLVATTFRGALVLNFVHPVPLVGPERADRIAARAAQLLRDATQGDPVVGAIAPASAPSQAEEVAA